MAAKDDALIKSSMSLYASVHSSSSLLSFSHSMSLLYGGADAAITAAAAAALCNAFVLVRTQRQQETAFFH